MRCQTTILSEQTQVANFQEDPFEIFKDFRSVMLKKRRKLLRKQNKLTKLRQQYHLSISKRQSQINNRTQILKRATSQNDEQWDAFFDDSQNFKKQSISTDYFSNGFNQFSSEDSMLDQQCNLFSNPIRVSQKDSMYIQAFTQFYYEPQV